MSVIPAATRFAAGPHTRQGYGFTEYRVHQRALSTWAWCVDLVGRRERLLDPGERTPLNFIVNCCWSSHR